MPSSTRADARQLEHTCPSARCEPGATLLGIVNADGTVGYVTPPLQIDAGFVEQARQGRAPEKRFRFAGSCVEGGCAQWTGSRCGVIDRVLDSGLPVDGDAPTRAALPRCAIRSTCRWFAQSGARACGACPLVTTDMTDG
jgi:hypothetical protein